MKFTNIKTIFGVLKLPSFWPQIPFLLRSFWIQFSVASSTLPSIFRPRPPICRGGDGLNLQVVLWWCFLFKSYSVFLICWTLTVLEWTCAVLANLTTSLTSASVFSSIVSNISSYLWCRAICTNALAKHSISLALVVLQYFKYKYHKYHHDKMAHQHPFFIKMLTEDTSGLLVVFQSLV